MLFEDLQRCARHYLCGNQQCEELVRTVMGDKWSLERVLRPMVRVQWPLSAEVSLELPPEAVEDEFYLPALVTAIEEEAECAIIAEAAPGEAGHGRPRLAILAKRLSGGGEDGDLIACSIIAYTVDSIEWLPKLRVNAQLRALIPVMDAALREPLVSLAVEFGDTFQEVFCNLARPIMQIAWFNLNRGQEIVH